MKKTLLTVLSTIAFIAGFFLFYQNRSTEQKTPTPGAAQQTSSSQKWETKIDDQESVTVVVTPLDLSPQSAEWKFDIGMNTHSVELDQDMTKIAVLVDGQGKEYKPLAWEGAEPGGHHREGVLIFNAIQPMPQTVEIRIRDIGSVPERSFKWDMR